ncbi:MAG: hypothetical protein AAB928_01200 [Patescibacteria group bacterium]
MKIGFYCFDNAGGDAMKLLAEAAFKAGHEDVLFSKQTRGLALEEEIAGFDAMVTGLSSFETEQELAFAEICLRHNIPWYVFEDVPGACLRPKAKDLAPRAKLVFLALPSGADDAREFGYPGSVYLGPPPQWRVEYETLTQAKAENWRSKMCKRIGSGEATFGLYQNDKVVGLIGGKDPEENNRVIKLLVSVVLGMGKDNIVIAFGRHPGEKPNPDKPGDQGRFERAFAERSNMLESIWTGVTDDTGVWKGSRIAGAADVMVYASGTNISIAGAYARVPAVYLDDKGVRERIKSQSGQEKWFVAELGGAYKASGDFGLSMALNMLIKDPSARQDLYHLQEQAFPLPDDWHTEHKIIRFVEQTFRP